MAFPKKTAGKQQANRGITFAVGSSIPEPMVEQIGWAPVWCGKHHFENLKTGNLSACGCPPGPQVRTLWTPAREILYGGSRGSGKALTLDAKVLTPMGWVRMGDLYVGSMISDPTNGGSTMVIGVSPRQSERVYRLKFDDGATVVAGLSHEWSFKLPNHIRPRTKRSVQREYAQAVLGANVLNNRWDRLKIGTTADLIRYIDAGWRPRMPLSEPILFTLNQNISQHLPAYMLGLMLGDGYLRNKSITSCDDEIRDYLSGLGFSPCSALHSDGKPKQWLAIGQLGQKLDAWLRNHNLIDCHSWDKFIPKHVFVADLEYRLEFLRGLMDSDGTVAADGHCDFTSTSRQLAEDVQTLARGLGGKTFWRDQSPTYTYKGEKLNGRPAYTVEIQIPRTSALFRLARKRDRCTDSWNGGHEIMRALESVEELGIEETQCIQVSNPYGLYVADDYTVTHNSELGRGWLLRGNNGEPKQHPVNAAGQPICQKVRVNGAEFCPYCVNASYINHPRYRALILRENEKDLYDWLGRAKDLFGRMGASVTEKPAIIKWPSGAEFRLGHMADASAYTDYMGHEYHRINVEELTHIPKKDLYQKITMSCRSTFKCVKGCKPGTCLCGVLRPQIFTSANPGGRGHAWVREHFVKAGTPNEVFADQTGRTRVFIPARVTDNPYLMRDNDYISDLMSIDDPALRAAWLEGDWDAFGGMFFRNFRPAGAKAGEPDAARHVFPQCSVDASLMPWWPRAIGMDWGYNHPSGVLWGCINQTDGKTYIYREIHVREMGADEIGEDIARRTLPDLQQSGPIPLYLSPDAFAKKDANLSIAEQVAVGIERVMGPGSAFILHRTQDERALDEAGAIRSMHRRFEAGGAEAMIYIRPANNRRVDGWQHMRSLLRFEPPEQVTPDDEHVRWLMEQQGGEQLAAEYMKRVTRKEKPRSYPALAIGDSCKQLIREIQDAVYDEGTEDILENEEQSMDVLSAARYLLMGIQDRTTQMPYGAYMQERMEKARQRGVVTDDINRKIMMWAVGEAQFNKQHKPPRAIEHFARLGVM